eukprot:Pgem_evm1s8466
MSKMGDNALTDINKKNEEIKNEPATNPTNQGPPTKLRLNFLNSCLLTTNSLTSSLSFVIKIQFHMTQITKVYRKNMFAPTTHQFILTHLLTHKIIIYILITAPSILLGRGPVNKKSPFVTATDSVQVRAYVTEHTQTSKAHRFKKKRRKRYTSKNSTRVQVSHIKIKDITLYP